MALLELVDRPERGEETKVETKTEARPKVEAKPKAEAKVKPEAPKADVLPL